MRCGCASTDPVPVPTRRWFASRRRADSQGPRQSRGDTTSPDAGAASEYRSTTSGRPARPATRRARRPGRVAGPRPRCRSARRTAPAQSHGRYRNRCSACRRTNRRRRWRHCADPVGPSPTTVAMATTSPVVTDGSDAATTRHDERVKPRRPSRRRPDVGRTAFAGEHRCLTRARTDGARTEKGEIECSR